MKIQELLAEDVHDPNIDWNKFKLAFAALAAAPGLEDYGKIDGIIFLGLAGDPNSQSVLDVKLKGPARIGVADPDSARELGWNDGVGGGSRTAGEYYHTAYHDKGQLDNRGHQIRKAYHYGIIINQTHFDQASGEIHTDTLAHEAQHRGFDILWQIPEIVNNINPRTRKYIPDLKTEAEKIAGLGLENTGERDFLEHLMIYSYSVPWQIGPGPDPSHMFRSKEEVKMFRTMYQDINSAATAYVKRYPVPRGGLALLRKEVDRLTPDNVNIKVGKDASGKPVVTGFLDSIVDRVKNLFKGSPAAAAPRQLMSVDDKRQRYQDLLAKARGNK